MGFGDRLRQARDGAKLTGEELGRRLGVSKQTVSHWENGRYQPSLEQLVALCAELSVSADWFLELEHRGLSAESLAEAQAYDALSTADRRRWKTMRQAMFVGEPAVPTPEPRHGGR